MTRRRLLDMDWLEWLALAGFVAFILYHVGEVI
jgi:uncharacterized membrane protein YhaH (DUF805 family)